MILPSSLKRRFLMRMRKPLNLVRCKRRGAKVSQAFGAAGYARPSTSQEYFAALDDVVDTATGNILGSFGQRLRAFGNALARCFGAFEGNAADLKGEPSKGLDS